MKLKQVIEFMRIVTESTSISKETVLGLLEAIEQSEATEIIESDRAKGQLREHTVGADPNCIAEDPILEADDSQHVRDELARELQDLIDFDYYIDRDDVKLCLDANCITVEEVNMNSEALIKDVLDVVFNYLTSNYTLKERKND
jgi:hypothetical protein